MKRDLVPGCWSVDLTRAVPESAAQARAVERDWRAQADGGCAEEGACANWGISWAFDPAPPRRERLTVWHLIVGLVTAAAVLSVILIAMTDAGLIAGPLQ